MLRRLTVAGSADRWARPFLWPRVAWRASLLSSIFSLHKHCQTAPLLRELGLKMRCARKFLFIWRSRPQQMRTLSRRVVFLASFCEESPSALQKICGDWRGYFSTSQILTLWGHPWVHKSVWKLVKSQSFTIISSRDTTFCQDRTENH